MGNSSAAAELLPGVLAAARLRSCVTVCCCVASPLKGIPKHPRINSKRRIARPWSRFCQERRKKGLESHYRPGAAGLDLVLASERLCTALGELVMRHKTYTLMATAAIAIAQPTRAQCINWQPLDSGVAGGAGSPKVNAVLEYNGDLIAGGGFATAGSQPATNIARWDGTFWNPMGAGLNTVLCLSTYNGDLIAGNSALVSRWDGSAWQTLGTANSAINSLTVYNGNLIAG